MAAPLIGRGAHVAQIRRLLATQSPVLVTGMAGIGKTAMLNHLAESYPGQVWWLQSDD